MALCIFPAVIVASSLRATEIEITVTGTAPAVKAQSPAAKPPSPEPAAPSPAPGPAASPAGPTPEDQPFAIPPNPRLGRDFQKQEDDWYERAMAQPFLKQIPDGTPWKGGANDYIHEAIRTWEKQLTSFKKPAADGKKLIATGCKDPLISVLVQFFSAYSGDKANTVDTARAAFAQLDHDKLYPPAIIRMAALATNEVMQAVTSGRDPQLDARAVELGKEAIQAGNYAGADEDLLLHHTLAWSWGWNHFINNYDALAAAYADAKAPDWVMHTLKGYIEVKWAWDRRGPGYANTVSKEGWLSFNQRYDVARDEYTASWKEHPTRPEAASEMIGITMAGHGHPGDTMRLWLDRAVAAQFDYIQAYDAMIWGLRPRWGGSVERMLKFARVCAETKRFDTDVPNQFFRMIDNATEETDWRNVYRSPIVADIVVPTAMGIADAPANQSRWQQNYSLAAVEAYLVGDGAAAASALNAAGGQLASDGRNLLYQRGGDFDVMQREIAVLQSPAGQTFWQGEEAYDKGQLDQALDAFHHCADALKGSPLAAAPQAKAESIQVELNLAKGGWVKLPMEAAAWHFQGGTWVTAAPDCLAIDGSCGKATAYATPRLGPTFDMRGEIEVDSPGKDEAEVAVLLGEHGTGYFATCGFKQNKGVNNLHASARDRWDDSTAQSAEVAAQTPNTFLLHVENNQVTFQLNGIPVVANYRANSSPLNKQQSRIGFAVRGLHAGTIIKIRNFEVKTHDGPQVLSML